MGIGSLAPLNICILGGEEGRTGRTFKGCRGCLLGELWGVDPRAGLLDDDVKVFRSVVIVHGVQWQNAQEFEDVRISYKVLGCG